LERRARVPGGKTLVLRVECAEGTIKSLRLSGDFFFYPEEGLEDLESFLLNEKVWKMGNVEEVVASFMRDRGHRAVGFGPADLAYLLRGLKC